MYGSFQFLGIPPKGELVNGPVALMGYAYILFPISRDPPEGGTIASRVGAFPKCAEFPISRDPPEGGTQG